MLQFKEIHGKSNKSYSIDRLKNLLLSFLFVFIKKCYAKNNNGYYTFKTDNKQKKGSSCIINLPVLLFYAYFFPKEKSSLQPTF